MSRQQFRSKNDAMNRRKHAWSCLQCGTDYIHKQKRCNCGGDLQYFPSTAELRRYKALRLEQRYGKIEGLELQPTYRCVINGLPVTTYRADFLYTRDGSQVVEDVKGTTNEKYLTPEFKLKRKLVQAIFGVQISIVKG